MTGYLLMTVTGRYDLFEFKKVVTRGHVEAEGRGYVHLLVEMAGMAGKIADWDRFQLGEHAAQVFGHKFKVAVVYRSDEINYFAETVATNRAARLGVFPSSEKATAWLLE